MIFEHEIPDGSRLYFGETAKLKREIETIASSYLIEKGFEEVVTPNFTYSGHQSIDDIKRLITLQDESNNTLALRADSTLDAVRIITKRLGRATEHEKWFYIQPVFSYPSNEFYQIGVEYIEHENIADIINLNCQLLDILKLDATVQLANINIPLIISQEYGIDLAVFKDGEICKLFEYNLDWLNNLIEIQTIDQLESIIDTVPTLVQEQCSKLLKIAKEINYKDVVVSPLFYSAMKYYDDIYYKVLQGNYTIAKGGGYKSNSIKSLGFALYTDNIIKIKQKGHDE
ncbi:MAG: ATP phosphoribosyltransferase regulatory subunit [Campylobacterales bacterium]|nr:ATP phosphoribosyltransferase regulatory subunit [Campylobacterales bacterium]